jgi:SPP1 family predicted phage head-tail adaptor
MVRAGQLRHLVTVQNPTRTATASGGYTESWTSAEPMTAWVHVAPVAGVTEGVSAQVERAAITHEVTARYHSGITQRSRLAFGSRYLYVRGIQNLDERNQVMVLACEERQ